MADENTPAKVVSPTTTTEAPASSSSQKPPKESSEISNTPPTKKQSWYTWSKDTLEQRVHKHLEKEYNGKRGFNGHFFQRPTKSEVDDLARTYEKSSEIESDSRGRIVYRNQLGQEYAKYDDVATYLSPTNYVPKRLVVQSTRYVWDNQLKSGDWRRTKLTGSVPTVLKIAEWALKPANRDRKGRVSMFGRVHSIIRILVVGLPLQIMLVLPGTGSWEDGDTNDKYTEFPGYHWKWPKYAINPLDMKPGTESQSGSEKAKTVVGSRQRLLRPRQLIVLRDNEWVLDPNPDRSLSYLFISYANLHFDTNNSEAGRRQISEMAAFATRKAGKQAYWLDYRCRAPEPGPELDGDVYRMCDVIRGAHQVVVMLKADKQTLKAEWGSRMWTLPEALLAPGDNVFFCTPTEDSFQISSMSKVEMSGSVWEDTIAEDEDTPTRLLAEHFTGLLTLSRLEILSNAIAALGDRAYKNYQSHTRADIAYALMGLLHYRIEKSPTDTAFQAIARLSLANDSDRLIERMISLYPDPHDTSTSSFMQLSKADLYSTHLWDVEPLCQIVGVAGEDNTIILDGCRAMHIRWKGFPRANVKRHYGFKKLLAELFVRSGAWWFLFGINLTITYAPFFTFSNGLSSKSLVLALELLVGCFFIVGLLLSFCGPYSVRRLYGGQVLQSTPSLVGFEGVLPLSELETIIFGNCNGRLSYAPSGTPFSLSYRSKDLRVGVEPSWILDPTPENNIETVRASLPPKHHLFTLVDTGSLTVMIFSAEKPPTVALITGREGGMLRVGLCSWRFGNDCLVREAVVRMDSCVEEAAVKKGWLKVRLGRSGEDGGL
ncbi:hypothetical protein BGZ60DRAFT_406032 [Tricladium varicosporioides]|nr:hypothetical protein BGZ60DRAFT_406032 [Hymenoscyphus varicosporioides]